MKQIVIIISSLLFSTAILAQKILFKGDFSPSEGLVKPLEMPLRDEICLNGLWEVQTFTAPQGWRQGVSPAPELPPTSETSWDAIKIKIPSPVNVNNWGGGIKTGEGTNLPYAPNSVYYPSYPEKWSRARMAWFRKSFEVPKTWENKRTILHFEAIAGESTVYVNKKEVGKNFDNFLPFELDITDYIKPNEQNEILVGVRHSKFFDKSHPEYSKFGATYPPGSNTDDLLGIWQDVFLFAIPSVHIADVFIKPQVDRNILEVEVKLHNQSGKKQIINISGIINEWLNKVDYSNSVSAAEVEWETGKTTLTVSGVKKIELNKGETKTIVLQQVIHEELKFWSPKQPNLYILLLHLEENGRTIDSKETRFGWRQFKISGNEFYLNGEKIQCFGDIQHPFGAYICSRRFAYAWYQMIKDFGGNAVRPHAQPWPRVYYDLADEMGLMVLDETALFGSSIRLNLEEDITWQRSHEHLQRLILRDRNHPSVIGWSAGNEMFAIALLNKPEKNVSDKWDEKLVELTLSARETDPTRDFITLDGDRDMDGRLPVWSKHFGHGLRIDELPKDLNKPLIVGEFSATYYGKPSQLYPFAGNKVFESYYGRNEALAVDVYQNATLMARPYLAYFSPSEVSWFGIKHLNLGYHDFFRLPNLEDGIFAGKPYEEGKPGYQFERIPPYVTTFNPGLDPQLPLYHPLPMFEALKSALSSEKPLPCEWDEYNEFTLPQLPAFLPPKYTSMSLIGKHNSSLHSHLNRFGIDIEPLNNATDLIVIEASSVAEADLQKASKYIENIRKKGGLIWIMCFEKIDNQLFDSLFPMRWTLTDRKATALESNTDTEWGKYFDLPRLYFAESENDPLIIKCGIKYEAVESGKTILTASRTDWSLFNQQPENRKCAQIVLYEHIQKPSGAALVTFKFGEGDIVISTLDYRIINKETNVFWESLFSAMQIKTKNNTNIKKSRNQKTHDLLLDGPQEIEK